MAYTPFVTTDAIMKAFIARLPDMKIPFQREAAVIDLMSTPGAADAIVRLDPGQTDWRHATMAGTIEGRSVKARSMREIADILGACTWDPYILLPTAEGRLAMFGADGDECVEILDTGAGYRVTRLDARAWDVDPTVMPAPETHVTLFDAWKAAQRMTGIARPRMHRSGDAWRP